MNGEEKKLALDYWQVWKESHDANSKRVEDKIDSLNKKLETFIQHVPCQTHIEKLSWLQRSTNLLWSVIIISGIVGIGLWVLRGIVA